MTPRWYERACDKLQEGDNNELLDYETYRNEMRDLDDQLREEAEQAAIDTYFSFFE